MSLHLRGKILCLVLAGAALTAVVGALSLRANLRENQLLEQLLNAQTAVSNHQEVDMMHDAIRGDIMALRLATDDQGRQAALKDFHDHAQVMRDQLQANAAMTLSPNLTEALGAAKPLVEGYLQAAEAVFQAAPADLSSRVAAFATAFEAAEEGLGTVTERANETLVTVRSESKDLLQHTIVLVGVVLVVGLAGLLVISLILANRLTRSIKTVAVQMQAMASGDYTGALPDRAGDDEVAVMTRAVQDLQRAARTNFSALQRTGATLDATAQQLDRQGQNLIEAAGSLSQQAMSAAATTEEISTGISAVAGSSTQLSAAIQEIAARAGEAAQTATQGLDQARAVGTTMEALGASSADIASIVKTIGAIAEQTNLLALNAAIEAASAGEAGRGFAVVAGEVKNLARQVTAATEDISQRVNTIQTDTAAAREAIAAIGTTIDRIHQAQQSIAAAVEEQSATTAEISRSVGEAANSSTIIASTITAVASGAETANGAARQAGEAARQLLDLAADLRKHLNVTRC